MKSPVSLRSLLTAAAAVLIFISAGCEAGNSSNVASSTGPGSQTDTRSSGVGPGGHQPATNNSTHGPTNAGPAGSQ